MFLPIKDNQVLFLAGGVVSEWGYLACIPEHPRTSNNYDNYEKNR